MTDTRVNLAASLHRLAMDLSEVAAALPALGTDQEIEQQADMLDHIADEARDGAAILRGLIAHREREHSAAGGLP
jgi:hypothetical protein